MDGMSSFSLTSSALAALPRLSRHTLAQDTSFYTAKSAPTSEEQIQFSIPCSLLLANQAATGALVSRGSKRKGKKRWKRLTEQSQLIPVCLTKNAIYGYIIHVRDIDPVEEAANTSRLHPTDCMCLLIFIATVCRPCFAKRKQEMNDIET